jgi:hypothetical protein
VNARRLRDGLRPCLAVFLAARIGLSLASVVAVGLIEPLPPVDVPGRAGPPATTGWHNLIDGTERQDAAWYLRLAEEGWSPADPSAAFFPLYPLAVRVVSWILPGDDLLAALLVSNAAFFGVLLVLFALTAESFGERIARRAVAVAAIFPTAFFFLAPYSESLFLLFVLLAFRAVRRDRWTEVAAFGAAAALTRSAGILLVPAFAIETLRPGIPARARASRLAGTAAIAIGSLAWFAWWGLEHGRWLAPFDAQRSWQREPAFPWETVADAISLAFHHRSYWLLDLAIVTIAITGFVLALPSLRAPEVAYGSLSFLLPLIDPFPSRPLLSLPRFVVVIFPALWGLSGVGWGRALPERLVIATLGAGWAISVLLFVTWRYLF